VPSITTQPTNQTVTPGQTAVFTVVASGTTPLSYQWQKGEANIDGATSPSYTTPPTTVSDSGSRFRVVVANSAGSATSTEATLTVASVVQGPSITQQPADESVTAGQTATFTVVAAGTAPLSYQWQKGEVNIDKATSPSYTTPATSLADSGSQFRVIISNSAGNVTSNTATLTVTASALAPSILQQPVNQTVQVGQTATFTVVAAGTAPLSYQWRKGEVNIDKATSPSYTTPATSSADSGSQFRVMVSNSAGNVTSNTATLTVTASALAPSILQQPANQTVQVGQTATFTVVASGTAPLTYQWQKNRTMISGATSTTYTTPPSTPGDGGSQFRVVVSNSAGTVTSRAASLTVTSTSGGVDMLTYHNNNARAGANLAETLLTKANVNAATFAKIDFFPVDGKVDAQPLYLSQLAIPNQGTHNVLYVASEHDTVYAFDADTGKVLWRKSMLGAGETSSDARDCNQIVPEIGVTATPVIDRTRGPHGTVYVVAMSRNRSSYFQRLHALDVATGAELFGGPTEIQASYSGTGDNASGGNVIFDPKQYKARPGLLLLDGIVYTMWASHCDIQPYTGWVIGFDASTLSRTRVLNLTPNGIEGAIWMSDTAPAADNSGNIFLLNGNGTFDTSLDSNGFPSHSNFGNCFLKLATSGGLSVADYFTMSNTLAESAVDEDLGSGGAIVLPDFRDASGQVKHLAVGAGKDAHIYVVDRDDMGKFNANGNHVYQDISGALSAGVFSMPAYFGDTVYFGPVGQAIKSFSIIDAKLSITPSNHTLNSFGYPGVTPSISANGSANAILWAVENGPTAILHAYDANDISQELYNSNQSTPRDLLGPGNKFITPTIVNGKVYVGTTRGVAVFGLREMKVR
jgi:PQQ enzyme repeat/Immunoglobulin I-set domain